MLLGENPKIITTKSMIQLAEMDIKLGRAHDNLSVPSLVELIINRKEGILSSTGALSVKTGRFTGRSPDDKYIVDDESHTASSTGARLTTQSLRRTLTRYSIG